jgi:hypothetical protein
MLTAVSSCSLNFLSGSAVGQNIIFLLWEQDGYSDIRE